MIGYIRHDGRDERRDVAGAPWLGSGLAHQFTMISAPRVSMLRACGERVDESIAAARVLHLDCLVNTDLVPDLCSYKP